MKGDFTRVSFDPRNHFSRVLMQQGRGQLDADWNEQVAILLHHLRTLAADLIGPHGGPADSAGFEIIPSGTNDFTIGPGRYYVDGILCENDIRLDEHQRPLPLSYKDQPMYPLDDADTLQNNRTYLIYLDVWERHITYIQDDSIREVALGGPDTATRAKVVWQVKARKLDRATNCEDFEPSWITLVNEWQSENRGRLKAKAKVPEDAGTTDPCITPPEARYRGAENQLYRVEIHKDGTAAEGATFKWSCDNGSVAFPIRTLADNTATLEHLGRDSGLGLKIDDWVEIVDDDYVLQGRATPLLQVDKIDPINLQVTLKEAKEAPASDVGREPEKHPLLRRWDHKAGEPTEAAPELADNGALLVQEDKWINLEDGVQIYFQGTQTEAGEGHRYRTGDYWLIPARTATRDVEWPGPAESPEAQPPHGIEHHYAPLAIITVDSGGTVGVEDCRRVFEPVDKVHEPGIRIVKVTDIEKNSLSNDSVVPVETLAKGLRVVCDAPIDVNSFGRILGRKPTCYVTVELPLLTRFSKEDHLTVSYLPVILGAKVSLVVDDDMVIQWTPLEGTSAWLESTSAGPLPLWRPAKDDPRGNRVLVHLTLKGNFVWAEKDPDKYLDGGALGILSKQNKETTGLRLGEEEPRRSQDFEMWFWLEPPPTPTVGTIRGTVTDPTGAVIPGVTVTVTHVETGVSRTVQTNATGEYTIANLPPGDYLVEATHTGFKRAEKETRLAAGGAEQVLNFALEIPQQPRTVTLDRGTLRGVLRDAAGKPIAGARVMAVNQATGNQQVATTKQDGSYSIKKIPVGKYRITARAEGFKLVRKNIELKPNLVLDTNFDLQPTALFPGGGFAPGGSPFPGDLQPGLVTPTGGFPIPPAGPVRITAAPRIQGQPRRLDFGSVRLRSSERQKLTVSNTGNAPLNLTAVASDDPQFTMEEAAPFALEPNTEKGLSVRFAPKQTGAQEATLTIESNDPATPTLKVSLRGKGKRV